MDRIQRFVFSDSGDGITVAEARDLTDKVRSLVHTEVAIDGTTRELDTPTEALGSAGVVYEHLDLVIKSGALGAIGVAATRALADVIVAVVGGRASRRFEITRADGSRIVLEGGAVTKSVVLSALEEDAAETS